jgi:predicted alpha/beta-hydrolase family hydrolase
MSAVTKKKVRIQVPGDLEISGALAVPEGFERGRTTGVILGHGAGNDMSHPLMVTTADGLARSGYLTLRFNFPYKEEGKRAPDPPRRLMAAYRAAYDFLVEERERRPGRVIAGGKSLGGRMASMLVAGGLEAAGLLFLGYPLHPPGNPEKLRFEHLRRISIPMLFVQGTRDPLCELPLLRRLLKELPARTSVHVVEDGDHSFRLLERTGRSDEEVLREIVQVAGRWMKRVLPQG